MSLLDRIRAKGGDVRRDGLELKIKKGRLTSDDLTFVSRRREDLMRELWPAYDDFLERAAIREFDGGQDREGAEAAAYAEVQSYDDV